MKKNFLIAGTMLCAAVVMLSGFGTSTTGTASISVKVTLNDAPVHDALVGISTSDENRENSTYIHELETDAKGMIIFSNLSAGTYYLDAAQSTDEDSFYAEADVTVTDGRIDVTIELEVEE